MTVVNGSAVARPPAQNVDWTAVAEIRSIVAAELERVRSADRDAGLTLSDADERARAVSVITRATASWAQGAARSGKAVLSLDAERALAEAVYAVVFGLGRLQALVDREDVENVLVFGADRVAVELADGRVEWVPYPVAESDADLVEDLRSYGARFAQTGREFSPSAPLLNLRLPFGGPLGCRLAAVIEVAGRPHVVIRRHRLTNIGLDDLVANGTFSPGLAAFLSAAVAAGKNIIVSGGPAAGKTTLLRALAHLIPVTEHVVTVEDEYELGLHLGDQRRLVTGLEARTANAEGVGAVSMDALLTQALRHSPARVLVGEVRGGEVTAMLRALGNGATGGMCTLHARSAHAVPERIAALAQLATPPLPTTAAYQWTASAVDLIVHVHRHDTPTGRRRAVTDVLAVGPVSESNQPELTAVFAPGPAGRAVPAYPPEGLIRDLEAYGFDRSLLADGWG